MKKQFYLFSIVLALTVCMSVPARAQSNSNNDGGLGGILGWLFGNPPPNQGSGNQGTSAPINSNIVFLTIAGMAIGITAIKRTQKAPAKA